MRDRAMVFHNAEGIARKRLRKNIHIGENRAERRGKDGDSFLALGKESLAEERARDSVSYWIHEWFKTAEVYTIQRVSANSSRFRRRAGFLRALCTYSVSSALTKPQPIPGTYHPSAPHRATPPPDSASPVACRRTAAALSRAQFFARLRFRAFRRRYRRLR